MEDLGRVEAEDGQVSPASYGPALVADPKGMGSVVDDPLALLPRQRVEGNDVARIPETVDRQERCSTTRDGLGRGNRIQVIALGIDVREDRREAAPMNGMNRCRKRIGRRDDFTAEFEASQGDLDRRGAIAENRAETNVEMLQ
jgi:hypothetical protein